MTEPALVVWDSAGNVTFDSRVAYAGVCVGQLDIPSGTAVTVEYPDYAGRTLKAVSADGQGNWGVSIDAAPGWPRAIFAANAARSYVMFML